MDDTPAETPGGLPRILKLVSKEKKKREKPTDVAPQKIFEGYVPKMSKSRAGRRAVPKLSKKY